MAETTITVRDNGNLRISGSFEIVDATGAVFPVEPGRPVFLCRCGHSASKPFCDGSHTRVGFQNVARTVPEAAEPAADTGPGADAALSVDAAPGATTGPRAGDAAS